MTWPVALAATLALELPFAALLAPPGGRRALVRDAVVVNALTHPVAWLAILHLGVGVLATELAVVASEVLLYRALAGLAWRRAAVLALAANLTSAAAPYLV